MIIDISDISNKNKKLSKTKVPENLYDEMTAEELLLYLLHTTDLKSIIVIGEDEIGTFLLKSTKDVTRKDALWLLEIAKDEILFGQSRTDDNDNQIDNPIPNSATQEEDE